MMKARVGSEGWDWEAKGYEAPPLAPAERSNACIDPRHQKSRAEMSNASRRMGNWGGAQLTRKSGKHHELSSGIQGRALAEKDLSAFQASQNATR